MAGRGRPEKRRGIASVRELTPADIARLDSGERGSIPAVKSLRDSHHRVARLIASGMRLTDVAYETGYSLTRIYTLNATPAFKELVESYRDPENHSFYISRDHYYETLYGNMVKAERQISDRLDKADEEGDLLSIRELASISRDAADRTGYGKRSMHVNFNGDFATALEKAVKRSSKVIEGTTEPPATETRPPFRRI